MRSVPDNADLQGSATPGRIERRIPLGDRRDTADVRFAPPVLTMRFAPVGAAAEGGARRSPAEIADAVRARRVRPMARMSD